MTIAPAGQLRPSWCLGDLREGQRPRIERVPTIYRAILPSPELIERTADEGAPILNMTFALFNTWQEIDSPIEGRFMERVAPGAFRKSIKENLSNIRAILSHGKDPSLGQTVLGTIESIEEAPDGASARVSLFRSVPGLLLDGLRAGVYGASFRGNPIKSQFEYRPGRSAHNPDGLPEVTRREIRLRDIGPTPFAAYAGTTAKIGSVADGALPARSLPDLDRPPWFLGEDNEEPPWKLQRKDRDGLASTR